MWVWQLMRPGMITPPWASTTSASGWAAASVARGPTSTTFSPSTRTAPSSTKGLASSRVTTRPFVTSSIGSLPATRRRSATAGICAAAALSCRAGRAWGTRRPCFPARPLCHQKPNRFLAQLTKSYFATHRVWWVARGLHPRQPAISGCERSLTAAGGRADARAGGPAAQTRLVGRARGANLTCGASSRPITDLCVVPATQT